MTGLFTRLLAGFLFLVLLAPVTQAAQRIISLGGDVTEIVYALGVGDQLVARDTTSIFPEAANQLPDVGYLRQLSLEGILSFRPDLVLLSDAARPAPLAERLEAAGIKVARIPYQQDMAGVSRKIQAVATALNLEAEGAALLSRFEAQQQQLQALPDLPNLKGIFILSHAGMGAPLVAGVDSSANTLMNLAGLNNAIQGVQGYKPISPEGLVAARPEVLIVTEAGLQSLGGPVQVWQLPGLQHTPAARQQRLIVVDDLAFLGFGPRTAEAVLDLRNRLEQLVQ